MVVKSTSVCENESAYGSACMLYGMWIITEYQTCMILKKTGCQNILTSMNDAEIITLSMHKKTGLHVLEYCIFHRSYDLVGVIFLRSMDLFLLYYTRWFPIDLLLYIHRISLKEIRVVFQQLG